jgi:hypothetical protein
MDFVPEQVIVTDGPMIDVPQRGADTANIIIESFKKFFLNHRIDNHFIYKEALTNASRIPQYFMDVHMSDFEKRLEGEIIRNPNKYLPLVLF